MAEFQTGLPSTRLLQTTIREKREVQIDLISGKTIAGTLQWQDADTLCLLDAGGQTVLVWRTAIATLTPKRTG